MKYLIIKGRAENPQEPAVTQCRGHTGSCPNPSGLRSRCRPSVYARRVFFPLHCCDCLAGLGDGWWRRLCLETCSKVDRKPRGPLPAFPSCSQGRTEWEKPWLSLTLRKVLPFQLDYSKNILIFHKIIISFLSKYSYSGSKAQIMEGTDNVRLTRWLQRAGS